MVLPFQSKQILYPPKQENCKQSELVLTILVFSPQCFLAGKCWQVVTSVHKKFLPAISPTLPTQNQEINTLVKAAIPSLGKDAKYGKFNQTFVRPNTLVGGCGNV